MLLKLLGLLLFLIFITPLRVQLDFRHDGSALYRVRIWLWGIRLPTRDEPVSPPKRPSIKRQPQLQLLLKKKGLRRFLRRHFFLERLDVQLTLSLSDPAATSLLTGAVQQLTPLLPKRVRIAVVPDFLRQKNILAFRCIIFLHLGTLLITAVWAALRHAARKEDAPWNTPSASSCRQP